VASSPSFRPTLADGSVTKPISRDDDKSRHLPDRRLLGSPAVVGDLSTLDHMCLAIEALATGPGSIQARLQLAEPHFGAAFEEEMPTAPQKQLSLRLGAALVEGGDG
jgi:hypothetical protein